VSCEYGKKTKVFGAADTHHGGFAACHASKMNKHINAIIAVSASGLKAPPFFIVAGKNVMSSWLEPLKKDDIVEEMPSIAWLTNAKWWPDGAVVMTSENGSMEKRLIKFVVEHIDRFVRKFVLAEEEYCLTLDGHSSREGWEWLEQCKRLKCAVVQSPSSTTHFLQPFNQHVNKFLKRARRNARDKIVRFSHLDSRTVRCGLMVGTAAVHEISVDAVKKTSSGRVCGLWTIVSWTAFR